MVGWILIMRKEKVKEEVDDIVAAVASLPLGLMKVVYIRTIMPIMEDQEAKVLDITTIIRDLIIKEVACETLVVEMVAIKAMATTIIINLATIRVDKDLTTTTIIKEVAIIIIAKAMQEVEVVILAQIITMATNRTDAQTTSTTPTRSITSHRLEAVVNNNPEVVLTRRLPQIVIQQTIKIAKAILIMEPALNNSNRSRTYPNSKSSSTTTASGNNTMVYSRPRINFRH